MHLCIIIMFYNLRCVEKIEEKIVVVVAHDDCRAFCHHPPDSIFFIILPKRTRAGAQENVSSSHKSRQEGKTAPFTASPIYARSARMKYLNSWLRATSGRWISPCR